jgi:hypothetical protein
MCDATGSMGGFPLNHPHDQFSRSTFNSWHAGGVQFAIGDGKVTFLSENTDLSVLRFLAQMTDGNPVKVP